MIKGSHAPACLKMKGVFTKLFGCMKTDVEEKPKAATVAAAASSDHLIPLGRNGPLVSKLGLGAM